MATEKQIAANRRNARKSTGPRSAQGKARSRMNARQHGFASPDWQKGLYRILNEVSLGKQYTLLMEKRIEIANARATLLTTAERLLDRNEAKEAGQELRRAAALDYYERELDAAIRKCIKGCRDRGGAHEP